MGNGAREENADLSTKTKTEGAMTPPRKPTKGRMLQKTTEGNKPSGNNPSAERMTSKK